MTAILGNITNLGESSNWPSLERRRKIAKATMMYKILHNIVTVPFDQYRAPTAIFTRGSTRERLSLLFILLIGYKTVEYSLPESVIQARDVEEFKKLLETIILLAYKLAIGYS